MHLRATTMLAALFIVTVCVGFSLLLSSGGQEPATRRFLVEARQYAYDPPVIRVDRGDTVRIRLSSLDVVHGFFLEGYGIDGEIYPMKSAFRIKDPKEREGFREVDEIVFVVDKVGKFRYRCSHTCGYLHPFMQGELVVSPNHPYHAAVGAAVGIFLAGCFLSVRRIRRERQSAGARAEPAEAEVSAEDRLEEYAKGEADGN